MHLSCWFLATLSLASLAAGQAQTCYWPSGSSAPLLQACSVGSGNEAAACCFNNHYCMTNGLCLSPTEGTWYRGGCTDKDFQQTGCPKYCDTTDIVGATPNRHAGVWACASKVFACTSLDNCSKQNFTVGAYRAVMNVALSTDLADSATTATASASATSGSAGASETTSSDATGSTCPATENGISTGAAAGIGVGVGLPLAIAVGALTFMLMREKKRSRAAQTSYQRPGYGQQPGFNQQPYTSTPSHRGKPEGHFVPNEVSGHAATHELADTQGRHELGH
ncbi:hypothetical protein K456DRAFT_541810 [Colletotrichum gloeosporioides 23]|nr:hypothetical protein K456DRAFT_541810 [Colletotrichum gloeosporioides 23]